MGPTMLRVVIGILIRYTRHLHVTVLMLSFHVYDSSDVVVLSGHQSTGRRGHRGRWR